MAYNKELLKGTTPMLILQVLSTKDMHGYEIVKRMEEMSGQTLSVTQGSLYPILHNLEENGYLDACWVGDASERRKKVYHLTESGQKKLKALVDEWNHYTQSIYSVINKGEAYD